MIRSAAIGLAVSMLLTTVAALLIMTGTIHAQRVPQHVFSGYVSNLRQPLNDGFVRVTVGPGTGQRSHEVAYADIRQGRYKIAIVEPAGDNYSGRMLRFIVEYQGREYERSGEVRWGSGRTTELNFDIEGWTLRRQPQRLGDHPGRDDSGRQMHEEAEEDTRREQMGMERERRDREDEERRDMEREPMESEEEMRREQMEREAEMREREGEDRRDMERERIEAEEEMRREEMDRQQRMDEERMDLERERMELEYEMRREEMEQRREMERQLMERGQPGVQPVVGERSKSGPSRGLFSNRKAGEVTSGIDSVMDPTTLTIIGIVLTVLTAGMTLFRGN